MWSLPAEVTFLGAAGIVGGIATSAGAIASLITYPALLAAGLPPLTANVTHGVAVVGTGLGSTLASRPELKGTARQLSRWATVTVVGAAGGAALLLLTPSDLFDWVVPFLVAAAALLMLLQPRISAWRDARPSKGTRSLFSYGLFAVAIYDGYFGAASGIMTLALLLLTVEASLPRANALKNALIGMADVVAAVAFIIFGSVHWDAAIPLGVGFIVGGSIGPVVARRVSSEGLRVVIAGAGFVLAAWLLVQAI